MKYLLFSFLFVVYFSSYSQYSYEVELSESLNENRLGMWTFGDYKAYFELDVLESSFRNIGNSFLNPDLKNYYPDSVIASYNLSAQMYLEAAAQLKNAANGYDLTRINVAKGAEKENLDISSKMESLIQQLLENGQAVVYYKGKRVYTLCKLYKTHDKGFLMAYEIFVYFDDEKNCILKYHEDLGW